MRALARLATIGLSAGIVVIDRPPSAAAVEMSCALPPPIRSDPIAQITVDGERHKAFIYTLIGSKFAVDASGNLATWAVGNDQPPRPDLDFTELQDAKNFAWDAAVSGRCPSGG